MADARTHPESRSRGGCAHAYTITVGPLTKCTACGHVKVTDQLPFDDH